MKDFKKKFKVVGWLDVPPLNGGINSVLEAKMLELRLVQNDNKSYIMFYCLISTKAFLYEALEISLNTGLELCQCKGCISY